MINKISSNKVSSHKIIAIAIDDTLNSQKQPIYSFFQRNQTVYLVLEKNFDTALLFQKLRDYFLKNIDQTYSLDLNSFIKFTNKKIATINAIVFASILVHTFQIPLINKTKSFDKPFYLYNYDSVEQTLDQALNLVPSHLIARQLQMLPNNLFSIDDYIDLAINNFKKYDAKKVSVNILKKADLQKHQLNLITAVGSGSLKPNEPAMIEIKFINNQNDKKIIGLVGKGVMFDTGGVSLKPSNYMEGMHYDKSGSAIIFGLMQALIDTNQPVNAIAFLPLAVNDISERSYKINDILKSLNNKTIEITNTDAEGRLLLVNALEYAEKTYDLEDVITIATLTGAVEVAFGSTFTPFWSTNALLVNNVKMAASFASETVWQMPFHYEYLKKLETSKVADIVNSEKTRAAGSSVAAEFIRYFVTKANFLHFDIASSIDFNKVCYPNMLNTLYYYVISRFL